MFVTVHAVTATLCNCRQLLKRTAAAHSVSAAAATAAAALLEARRAIAAEAAAAAAVASQRLARHAEQLHTAVATESKAIREEATMVTANFNALNMIQSLICAQCSVQRACKVDIVCMCCRVYSVNLKLY
jgi:hypothetical protein